MSAALRGLYAITPDALAGEPERLLAAVAAALRGGATLIQYRDKRSTPAQRRALAAELARLCAAHGAPLIINDDPALAADHGAGVHLGSSDPDPAGVRARLGPQALIGVTCGDALARAQAAQAAGASYVAFGRFHPSRTKPLAPPARIETLRAARSALDLPLCAIGGITPALAPPLIAAGADLIAAIDGVFGAADIESAARAYAALF